MRHLVEIEPYNALAAQYGFALAWIYAGGKNYSSNKTEKEITAIINRLKTEYDIDSRNIFISGECEGGRRALVQLARTPEKYAACAAITPVTMTGGFDGIPINLIPKMGKVPVLIKCGNNDRPVYVEHSRRFVSESRKYDLPVVYIETEESHDYINGDHKRIVFEFFYKIAYGDIHEVVVYMTDVPVQKI